MLPVTVQWGPQSTWLDHLAFLDESRMVSAPPTPPTTISPAQPDPLGPQCRWLDQLAYLAETNENQNSAQRFSHASVPLPLRVWLDLLGFLASPPTTTVSPSNTSSSLPSPSWLDCLASLNICSIDPPPVAPTQPSITTLVRALSSAVVILPALLELHGPNLRRRAYINCRLAVMATLVYYALMVVDVPEQAIALACGFAFPFACSAAWWLWRTAILIPTEVPCHKYNALERSHQELTTKNDAAQENVKTLSNEKKLLAAAVRDLDGHVITLAQELDTTSRRVTKVEGELTAANQLSEDQVAVLVITLAQELDTTSRRVTKVEGELTAANQLTETQAARLASCSATVASLTEEAEYADLKHETLVMLQTDAMDQNVVLQGYLTEALEEKDRADTEHAQELQALTTKVEELRDSLDIARLGNNALPRSAWLKRLKEERFKYPLPAR